MPASIFTSRALAAALLAIRMSHAPFGASACAWCPCLGEENPAEDPREEMEERCDFAAVDAKNGKCKGCGFKFDRDEENNPVNILSPEHRECSKSKQKKWGPGVGAEDHHLFLGVPDRACKEGTMADFTGDGFVEGAACINCGFGPLDTLTNTKEDILEQHRIFSGSNAPRGSNRFRGTRAHAFDNAVSCIDCERHPIVGEESLTGLRNVQSRDLKEGLTIADHRGRIHDASDCAFDDFSEHRDTAIEGGTCSAQYLKKYNQLESAHLAALWAERMAQMDREKDVRRVGAPGIIWNSPRQRRRGVSGMIKTRTDEQGKRVVDIFSCRENRPRVGLFMRKGLVVGK